MAFGTSIRPKTRPILLRPRSEMRDLEMYPLVQGDIASGFSVEEQEAEFVACVLDPAYWIDNYAIVKHKKHGLVPFILYDYQRDKIMPCFRTRRKTITRKFRQGGFSTVAAALNTWMINFESDHEILVISKTDREAKDYMKMVYRFFDFMPPWMRAGIVQTNEHVFELDTGSKIMCYTPTAGVSYSCSLLVIDEAARVPKMEDKWGDIYPTLSTGGRVWVISTCNGVVGTGKWYYKKWMQAIEEWSEEAESLGKDVFFPLDIDVMEHPFYRSPKYLEDMLRELGDLKFRQEVMREFIGTRGSIFSDTLVRGLEEDIKKFEPIRIAPCPLLAQDGPQRNLYVWEPPQPGITYMVTIDVAEGLGENAPFGQKDDDNNYSVAHVMKMADLDPVAEYRNDAVSPGDFAKIVYALATQYNNALVVGADRPIDQMTLVPLGNQLGYANIYSSNPGVRPGLRVTGASRDPILLRGAMAIEKKLTPMKSPRLVNELRTIIKRQRIDHLPGYFDDLFSAYCYGLEARDSFVKSLPPDYVSAMKPIIDVNDERVSQARQTLQDGVISLLDPSLDAPVPPPPPVGEAAKMLKAQREWGII